MDQGNKNNHILCTYINILTVRGVGIVLDIWSSLYFINLLLIK